MTPTRRIGTLSSGTTAADAGGARDGHVAIGLAGGGGRRSSAALGTPLRTGGTPVPLSGKRSSIVVGPAAPGPIDLDGGAGRAAGAGALSRFGSGRSTWASPRVA